MNKKAYESPQLVAYGSLAELTASNGASDAEDGLGKILNTDGNANSSPL